MQFLGQVAYHFSMMQPLLPTYLHLIVSAIFPIYTAAHASLSRPSSAAPRKSKTKHEQDHEDDDTPTQIENLTPSDAVVFPLLAGATLASLYFILKWLQDPAWLNWALGLYFSQIGLFFATKFLKDAFSVMRSFCLPNEYSRGGSLWKVEERKNCFKTESGKSTSSPLPGLAWWIPFPNFVSTRIWKLRSLLYTKAQLKLHVHGLITLKSAVEFLDIFSLLLSCGAVYYHTFIDKPWFLTNFLGFSFCYGSLQYLSPTTAWTGSLVLGALFFYDIYFVFFTPMMVTVATKLDVPIKLLFPRPDGCVKPVGAPEGSAAMEDYLQCLAKKRTMAMLGLGDIVIPGMMLAFALRFDLYKFYLRQRGPNDDKNNNGKTEISKPVYVSATGGWGERFWTSSKLRPMTLQAKQFPKPYLCATIIGYIIGMVVTVIVMQVAQHAQPALLYLVPGVLGSLWGTALVKGDLKELWNYSEMPDSAKDDKEGDATKDEKAEGTRGDESKDKNSVENGHVETKVPETQAQRHGGEKAKEVEKSSRRLVYFSITLPSKPQDTSNETASERSKQDVQVDDKDDGLTDCNRERPGDGEPPEKRARRS